MESAWVLKAEKADVHHLWLCGSSILLQEVGTPVSKMMGTKHLSGYTFDLWPRDPHGEIQTNHRLPCLPFSYIDLCCLLTPAHALLGESMTSHPAESTQATYLIPLQPFKEMSDHLIVNITKTNHNLPQNREPLIFHMPIKVVTIFSSTV